MIKKSFLIFTFLCLIIIALFLLGDRVFVLISAPKVINTSPPNLTQNVSINSPLIIKFNKPVKRQEIQFSILPEVYGGYKFDDSLIKNHFFRTLIFTPVVNFRNQTQYQVKIENIKGFGFNLNSSFEFSFKTEPSRKLSSVKDTKTGEEEKENMKIVKLNIPLDWQDHPLSCEAASLKMALAQKGIYTSEKELMEKIGYDLTPRQKNIWGDPYQIYVGDINGKMCQTGYGVYWQPVARVAKKFRPAEAFSNWRIKDLTQEIQLGNPVIVWGVLPVPQLTDCSWYTPEGKYIRAFKETHVRVAIGFIGSSESPSRIILSDPLAGQLYWTTEYFLKNWETFNYSGVVIR